MNLFRGCMPGLPLLQEKQVDSEDAVEAYKVVPKSVEELGVWAHPL